MSSSTVRSPTSALCYHPSIGRCAKPHGDHRRDGHAVCEREPDGGRLECRQAAVGTSSVWEEPECRKRVNRVFCATAAGRLLYLEQRPWMLTNRSAEKWPPPFDTCDAESEQQRRNEHHMPLHRALA